MNNTINTLLLSTLFGLSAYAPAHADQHALLIGVSNYQNERIKDLEGPVNDVSALKEVLSNHWDVSASNISTLVNEQATERNIKLAFKSLLENTKKGDDIMIYFSGHGTSIKDQKFGAMLNLPHTSGALVAHDFDPSKHIARIKSGTPVGADDDGLIVGRHEIKPLLKQLSKDRTVFVIFDSCFSGNAVRSIDSQYTPKQKRLLNISLGTESELEIRTGSTGASRCINCEANNDVTPFDYDNVIYFGAAADNQLAIEHSQAEIDAGLASTIDGKPHGGFSDALLRVLSSTDLPTTDAISYRQLFSLLVGTFNMNCANCAHNPVILPVNDSSALLKPVLSKTIRTAATIGSSLESSTHTSDLQIDITNLGKPMSKAIDLIGSVQMNSTLPDIILSKNEDGIEARSADGLLVSRLPINTKAADITEWVSAQAWLKQRKAADAKQNSGTILAYFRNPLTNPVAFEGESVYFTVSLEQDAKLVLLHTNSNGELNLFYPSNKQQSERVFSAATTIQFPERNDMVLKVTEPWGTDNIAIYALPAESSLSSLILPLAHESNFTHAEPLLTRFTDALDSASTQYSTAHVRFHAAP